MPNRLATELSPYLLQHKDNPVDWYPWGPEALARAKAEDKPIFLSIGYSACHWCHVMEHESFENPDIARALNESFVNIKVDREERPDLDQIYMHAVQLMTGRGGWPMSTFLTPNLRPFYGGTYWPPTSRGGMPGFDQVIAAVRDAWQSRREAVFEQAHELTKSLQQAAGAELKSGPLATELLRGAAAYLERIFDHRHGGFGGAPKFPHPMDIRVLLRVWRRVPRDGVLKLATLTLEKMAAGGIYDHLGGGFHRYSVDERWLVPHFEKMLYDNALLACAYLEAYQATGRDEFARVVCETLDYLLREMTGPAGGFYSTQDADSEGVEGKFYVWTPPEVAEVLGQERAKTFCRVYDVSEAGNFEEANILNLPRSVEQCSNMLGREADELVAELADGKAKLLAVRNRRIWPGLDDKVLVSWNGLAIDAFAQAGATLGEPRYTAAAAKAADFILTQMRRADGRLLHAWRDSQARFDAYLDDYTCLGNALVTLYQATFDERWIDEAISLADTVLTRFSDPAGGGFFYTADDHEVLISRQKDIQDSSVPSGNAMAATMLLRLGKLTGRPEFLDAGRRTLESCAELMERHPTAAGQMLLALDFQLGPTPELVLTGPASETEAIVADLHRRHWPNKVLAHRPSGGKSIAALDPLFQGRSDAPAQPTLYVCEGFACQAPVVGRDAILAKLDAISTSLSPSEKQPE